ncbi:MAG: hypothetical protein Q8M17_14940 [Actinomycetota bacterium]|nr:hypothetical protein [Actinomycetota bacterium]
MRRASAVVASIALALALAGCGGSGGDDKQTVLDDLRAELISEGATEAQADCVVGGIDDMSVEDLKSMQGDEAPSQEIQDKVLGVITECALGG